MRNEGEVSQVAQIMGIKAGQVPDICQRVGAICTCQWIGCGVNEKGIVSNDSKL